MESKHSKEMGPIGPNIIEKGIDIKNRFLKVNHKHPFPSTLSRAWIALHFIEGTKLIDLIGVHMV